MDFFFEPNGVAVVGATPEPVSGGRQLLTNLTFGYKKPIYPVNPKYDEILGIKCYSKVSAIKDPVDLALIFVPAPAVPQVLEDCVIKGVRGVIIQSGGFAEIGSEGKALQDQCLAIARKGGLRIWGPNCMGLIDTWKPYVFSFVTTEAWKGAMNPGGVSLIVQSGLLSARFITTLMANRTLGLAKVCSIGNKSDVEETELLEYLLNDPATKVVGLYLESFIHGRRFFELATSATKPIVVLTGGKTSLGAEASISHTASLSGNDALIRGVLRQAGVHLADDFFEMTDIARSLEKGFLIRQSPAKKPGIAILSYSGAAGIVTTDHLVKNGLTLARLSSQTLRRLEDLSPPWMPVRNPVDFWPAIEKHGIELPYKVGLEALYDDPEVDGIIVHLFAGSGIWFLNMKEIMLDIKKPAKPILFWLMGPEESREATRMALEEEGWPTFSEIHRTVTVMAKLFEHPRREDGGPPADQWRSAKSTERSKVPYLSLQDTSSLNELSRQADEQGATILDEHEAKKWLKALNLKVVEEEMVKSYAAALRASHKMGFPVVLKGRVEGQVHKTEAGFVKLNLYNPSHLRSAYQEMLSLTSKPQFFMIQPMLKSDLELIAGIVRDPSFGPAVMFGLGGIWTEVYRDVVFRLAPLNEEEVSGMVSDLRGQVLFKGYRGSKPVNMKSLSDWLIRLGWLAQTFEKIEEIDINPLLIVDGEPIAVDATIILKSDFHS